MIVGHYAPAFLASARWPRVPLWLSATAVVLLDILHSSLVLAGVEEARLSPGITAAVPVELVHYPYSHSLVAALLWSLMAGVCFMLFVDRRGPARPRVIAGLVVGACVLSHYVLDWVAHRPDLPIGFGDGPRIGLGLWDHFVVTHLVENALMFGSLAWFLRARRGTMTARGRRELTVMCAVGTLVFLLIPVVPVPGDIRSAEVFMLITYAAVPWVCWRSEHLPPTHPRDPPGDLARASAP